MLCTLPAILVLKDNPVQNVKGLESYEEKGAVSNLVKIDAA